MAVMRWCITALCGLLLAGVSLPCVADVERVKTFDIEAQPLTSALLEFGQQSDFSVGFVESLAASKIANRIHGRYSARTALELLLNGTELAFEVIDDETIAIVSLPPAALTKAGTDEPVDEQRVASASVSPSAENPEAADAAKRSDEVRSVDEVIVLGSHIAGAGISDALPVTIWHRDRIGAQAAIDGGDLFRALPFAGATTFNGIDTYFAGVNSARGDIASINLRDLGTGNSLVLLNGRRMVAHPGVQTEYRVPAMTTNMNVVPVSLLERIEILRDGASAVYGTDAVAGVVNEVLRRDFSGASIKGQVGIEENTGMSEMEVSLHVGRTLNEGRSRLQLMAVLAGRTGVHSSERAYSSSSNLQPLLAGTENENNTAFNNTSVIGAWGQFRLPAQVLQNGMPLTTASGVFHLQPVSLGGCVASLGENVCISDTLLPPELYGDHNTGRQLIPELKRATVVVTGEHTLTEETELYGEFVHYQADSDRISGAGVVLPSTPVTMPASNYWNPFGPETFSDGRVNPNRLPGIDAPAEGYDITLDSSFFGSSYLVADAGQRPIEVRNSSDRALVGLRGNLPGWQWDSALLYARAGTDDRTGNRVSNTLFQQALSLETPQAYNLFNGGNPVDTTSVIDTNPNPSAVIAPFLISVSRVNEVRLGMADFRVSVPDFLMMRGGAAPAAFGVEIRREEFKEDRDHRFNGTTKFTDIVTGETFDSDVMGTSVAADVAASRSVVSLFGEIALPLVGENNKLPFVESLNVQLASRYETYSDVGDTFSPRLAFSWRPFGPFNLRGSISQGIRVPNLPQLNADQTRRVLYGTDWYRCAALRNKGEIASLANCGALGRELIESSRSDSRALKPEDYRSTSFGLLIAPHNYNDLLVSIDYWKIEQEGIVGLFGVENQIAVDYAGRLAGGSNEQVIRAPLTQGDLELFAGSGLVPAGRIVQIQDSYVNLDRRTSSGIDLSLSFRYADLPFGDLMFDIDATRLISADQSLPPAALKINELNEPAINVVGAGDLLRRDSRPLWRAASFVQLERDNWRAGLSGQYVSSFYDTSTASDANGDYFVVDDMLTFGAYWEIETSFFGDTVKSIRIGARNIFDKNPPLADETFGYNAAMHSSYGRFWYLNVGAELK